MSENATLRAQLIGAWELVSFTQQTPEGTITYPMGKAIGSIYYLQEGLVSVHIMQPGRTNEIDIAGSYIHPLKYNEFGYLAYSGRFELNEQEGIIIHHTEISLYPEWVGGKQIRAIELKDGYLKLSSIGAVGPGGTSFVLIWKKLVN